MFYRIITGILEDYILLAPRWAEGIYSGGNQSQSLELLFFIRKHRKRLLQLVKHGGLTSWHVVLIVSLVV